MTTDRKIRIMAGTFILTSLVLSRVHSEYWLLMTAFVGLNLFQSGFTRFCPAERILRGGTKGENEGSCGC